MGDVPLPLSLEGGAAELGIDAKDSADVDVVV